MRYSKSMSLALALAAIPASLAQTFTSCDPTKKDCPSDVGLTKEYSVDFRQGAAALADWKTTSGSVAFTSEGGDFKIQKLGDGPTIGTNFNIFFGYVEVVMKAAPGAGIVSSFVMQSDDLDEIDWEWIGSDAAQAQSNYFGKGNTTTYDRGQFHPVNPAPQTSFQKYAVNWTQETTTWLINDKPVRTLNFADAVGGKNYPQTPMNIRLGNWVAGDPKNAPGTIQWAGGLTDFSKGPFDMVVQTVKIKNYNPGATYKYGDKTGDWQSIQIQGAPVQASESGSSDGSSQSSAAASASASGSSSLSGYGSGSAASSAVAAASSAPPPSGSLPVVSINLGSNGTASTSCTKSGVAASAAAVSSGSPSTPATVSINLGSQASAAAVSNSTGSGSSGSGIVGGPPSNATLPTYTIKPEAGAAASSTASNGSALTTSILTDSSSGSPMSTSFGLGSTSTTSAQAQQVTSNVGSRVMVGRVVGVLGVGLAFL